jgi:hypothetical protein
MLTLQEWLADVIGKNVDYDGNFGAQCVDLVRDYLERCHGVARESQPEATEGAAGWWAGWRSHPKAQKALARTGPPPAQGDIAVYPPKAGNPYGHICVVIGGGESGGKIAVAEQDGLRQGRGAEVSMRDAPGQGGGFFRPR